MRLIVGLGNPGSKYANTRHNAGFMAVDRIASRHSLGDAKSRANAASIEGRIGAHRVILLKPMTYMNLSGQAVAHVARFHRIEPPAILVLVDDMALPVGAIRLRPGGSSGGHNGLESIRQSLGTSDYPRLRIGIGAPMIGEHKIPQSDYVLGTFTDAQMKELAPALDKAADAVDSWLNDGLDSAMNRFNTKVTETPLDNPTQPGSRRPEL